MKFTSVMCWRYAKALALVAAALMLRMAIEQLTGAELPTFITFYPVIMFSALVMGFGPGVFAVAATVFMVDFFVVLPHQLGYWNLGIASSMTMFAGMGIFMCVIARRYRTMQLQMEALVTERTTALQESEGRLQLFIQHAPASLAMLDRDMRYISVSNRWLTDYGLGVQELVGKSHYEIFPEISGEWKELHRRALAGEVLSSDCDRFERVDGSVQWLRWEVRPWIEPAGTIGGIVIFTEDITERKAAEEMLSRQKIDVEVAWKNEQRERSLMEAVMDAMPTGVAVTDAAGGTLRSNAMFERVWGKRCPETASVEDYDAFKAWWGDTDRPVAPEEWASARAIHGESVVGQLLRIRRFDGTEAYVINSASPVYDSDGAIAGSVVSIQDITELKRAEAALRDSELKLRVLIDSAGESIWQFGLDGEILTANATAARRLGMSAEEMVGSKWQNYVSPELAESREERIAEVVRTKAPVLFEDERSGIRFEHSAYPVRDVTGAVASVAFFSRDITERRKAEKLLQESEERLRFHMENSPLAVIEWDRNFIVTCWTGESERLFGWSAGETIGRPITDLNMVYEDDLPIVGQTMARLTDGVSLKVVSTNRNYTKNGEVRHCTWYNSVLLDQQGKMKSVMSEVVDITDRVVAQDRLDLLAETASQLLLCENPQDIVESLCRRVMTALDCHVFFNFLANEQQDRLYLNACAGISAAERQKIASLDFGVGICGRSACEACRIVAEDIPNTPDPHTELVKSLGVTLYACHPLMVQDRIIGTLSFGSRTRISFTEDDLALMKAVADHVAIAIERMQTAQALYKSHEELEQRVVERTHELAASVRQLLDEIAERTRTEKRLQRLNRLYAVLSETNQTIVRSTDRDSLFQDFCRIAVEYGGFLLSWVGLVDNESGDIRRVAAFGATDYLEGINVTINEEPHGIGPTGVSVREGTYAICNDFQGSASTRPWHERGKAFGINSSASIALKEGGRVIGALTLYSREKNYFDRQHVELLQQMGVDVSFALDNMIREKQRLEAEQILQEETMQRLQAVEALRRQEHLMIQQNRQAAMGEMIGNIAHQWRQPLNTLGLLTQRLGLFYGSPSFNKEFLETSVAKSMEIISYMSRTIDDFRTFFAADREKTEFRVVETVSKVLSLVEASFKDRGINLERDEDDDVVITGYPNEYAQVLLNILINAKDAMNERNIESPWLKIAVRSHNGTSLVTIADNAGGISEDIVDKIFDPYFTTKGPQQGTGIGLFMARSIIENNMGGRLSVRNTGAGAEFRIEV